MGDKPNDGGPAFPTRTPPLVRMSDSGDDVVSIPGTEREWPGMTLRDWFAGQAMVRVIKLYDKLPDSAELLAEGCYRIADALLAEKDRTR
jgi:hypothetical protein